MPLPPIRKYDNHTLSTWRLCLLKGYYRHAEHLTPSVGHKAPALEYGIHIHSALDVLYTTKRIEDAQEEFWTSYSPVWEDFDPNEPNVQKHSPDVGMVMLKGYWDYWRESIMAMDLLACERYFAIDMKLYPVLQPCPDCGGVGLVGGPPCTMCDGAGELYGPVYCGVIDKVFRDKRSGLVVGMDHKTTSILSNAYVSSMKISQQFRGYMYWLRRHSPWANECDEYFYLDALNKTRTKYSQDGGPFYRDTILAQDEFLDEWQQDTWAHVQTIESILNAVSSGGRLPRQNSDACSKFNSLCMFYDLCSVPYSMRPTMAEQLYEIEPWDPLHRNDSDDS